MDEPWEVVSLPHIKFGHPIPHWFVRHKHSGRKKMIGPVKTTGFNWYDEAVAEAKRRNKAANEPKKRKPPKCPKCKGKVKYYQEEGHVTVTYHADSTGNPGFFGIVSYPEMKPLVWAVCAACGLRWKVRGIDSVYKMKSDADSNAVSVKVFAPHTAESILGIAPSRCPKINNTGNDATDKKAAEDKAE